MNERNDSPSERPFTGASTGAAPGALPPCSSADSDRREPWTRWELAALVAILGIALAFRV